MPRRARVALALALALGLAAAGGCNHDKKKSDAESTGAPAAASGAPAAKEKAVLEGVVRMAEGEELPSYPRELMERKVFSKGGPNDAPLPESCSPPKVKDRQPVQVTPDGLLAGVMLAASGFSHQPQRPPQVHNVTIEDCRLTPPLVVAMKGDTLRVRSTVNYPFMPTYREQGMARTLLPGQTYEVPLDKPGVQALLCAFSAPCGRTDVVVLMHPLYTTTDAQGHFRLDDLPTDEPIDINAWHPLFQESKLQVRLEPGEHKTVELVLRPAAPAAPPTPATAAPSGSGEAKAQPEPSKLKPPASARPN